MEEFPPKLPDKVSFVVPSSVLFFCNWDDVFFNNSLFSASCFLNTSNSVSIVTKFCLYVPSSVDSVVCG